MRQGGDFQRRQRVAKGTHNFIDITMRRQYSMISAYSYLTTVLRPVLEAAATI